MPEQRLARCQVVTHLPPSIVGKAGSLCRQVDQDDVESLERVVQLRTRNIDVVLQNRYRARDWNSTVLKSGDNRHGFDVTRTVGACCRGTSSAHLDT